MNDIDRDYLDLQALRDQSALRVFALYVDGQPRLLFPGQTERDIERYAPLQPGEVVSRVSDGEAGGDVWCGEASEEQAERWTEGFAAAVRSGQVEFTKPASFLLLVDEAVKLAQVSIGMPFASIAAAFSA